MKSAQIVRRFSFREWGGTESVVWNTAGQLTAAGDTVEILATKALDSTPESVRDGVVIRRFDYCYPYFPMTAARRQALDKKGGNPVVPALRRYLEREPFDLLHCHNLGRLAVLSVLAARARRAPCVMSFHGGCLDVPREEMREMLKPLRHTFPYGKILDKLSGADFDPLRHADALLCVGRNELELLRRQYPDRRVEYLPNGVDVARFAAAPQLDFRSRFGIPPARRILLSVSRIDYQKNQLALLDVLAELRKPADSGDDWQLVLIGPVTAGWYLEALRRKIAALQLAEFVTIIPGLPPDAPELPAAYHAATVFALPSRHEPFGIVILEAWASGVPVTAAPAGGIPYLVADGETGLLANPDRPKEFAGAIRRAERERIRLTRAAHAAVTADYTWMAIARKLQSLYRELLQRPSR